MKRSLSLLSVLLASLGIAGCEFIGDVFKAGLWVGIILILAVVLIIWGISKIFR